jgi:hypothetical protein
MRLMRRTATLVLMLSWTALPAAQAADVKPEDAAHASFEKKKEAVETVTPIQDGPRGWRVSGYFIK